MEAEDMIDKIINNQLREQAEKYEEKLSQKDKEIQELKALLARNK